MDTISANWQFLRAAQGHTDAPACIDALNALRQWRGGHPGRAYEVSRPVSMLEGPVEAELKCRIDDRQADVDLRACCRDFDVAARAVEALGRGEPLG